MTAEDEEFNRIEMESRIKQEYIRTMRKTTREEKISRPAVYEVPVNNRMIALMEELAIAKVCIRELGDRLATLEGERNFCPRCGKRLVDGSIHTCTPPMENT